MRNSGNNTIYYPGWIALIDGNPTDIRFQDSGGLMEIDVTKGSHLIEFRFGENLLRKIANSITFSSIVVILL